MVESVRPRTADKVRTINLDPSKYGTFAEIGAGQEVAKWFFRCSGTAGTVAKAMSAYDMTFSDSIYGECRRYVSRARLLQMLDHEYRTLVERLSLTKGKDSTFFVFADTVRAVPFGDSGECHGWLGVRLQMAPLSEPHDILIHVRLLDSENVDQMEALGIVGVNLIYAAFFYRDNLALFTHSLQDDLSRKRIEIDMLKFDGPGFAHIDNRLCALQLVESKLTDAAIFKPCGEVMQPDEVLFKKPILLLRGAFNPVTKVHLDMIEATRAHFCKSLPEDAEYVEIMETTMDNLLEMGDVDKEEFLRRADTMQRLGKTVLISRFAEFYSLTIYLARYTKSPAAIVLGVHLLQQIFDDKWYENLAGGTLEALGKLFMRHVQLYIYPGEDKSGRVTTVDTAPIPGHLRGIFDHLCEQEHIIGIKSSCPELLKHTPGDIRKLQCDNAPNWKDLVPEQAWDFFAR